MAILGALAPLALVLACGSTYSAEDPVPVSEGGAPESGPSSEGGADGNGPRSPDGSPALPECKAQRVLNIVAGNGGFAWFSQVWPLPDVITTYTATYSYDDPAKAALVAGTATDHPLYARKIGTRPLWQGISTRPDPTAFVFGRNETHTQVPSTFQSGGFDILALGALLQAPLGAPLPALGFSPARYGTAPGAPTLTSVALVEDAITAIKAVRPLTPAEEAELRPSAAIVTSWIGAATTTGRTRMAEQLLFAANAFRLGLVATILMPGTADDPHGAFTSGDATIGADLLTSTLDGFYSELAKSNETTCGHAGKPLSLADNVVLIVNGDTYKNPFAREGWGDGTPGNSNLLYVRSNGFLEPGWFGRVSNTAGRINFDPNTGTLSTDTSIVPSSSAALLGVLYAITRGDKSAIASFAGSTPYAGVIKPGM